MSRAGSGAARPQTTASESLPGPSGVPGHDPNWLLRAATGRKSPMGAAIGYALNHKAGLPALCHGQAPLLVEISELDPGFSR